MMLQLQDMHAHNINLVTPTHYSLQIIAAIQTAKKKGLKIPIVWNSNGYEKVETIERLEGLVDIYLPDFKYYDDQTAITYSSAKGYRNIATQAIREMYRQTGNIVTHNGIAIKGTLVRILVLPGNINKADKILQHIARHIGTELSISLMAQYYPAYKALAYAELATGISATDYTKAVDALEKNGFENGFVQELSCSDNYTPDFL